jgi:hypothetical protein
MIAKRWLKPVGIMPPTLIPRRQIGTVKCWKKEGYGTIIPDGSEHGSFVHRDALEVIANFSTRTQTF